MDCKPAFTEVPGAPYCYDPGILELVGALSERVAQLRQSGRLSPSVLGHISRYFRIKNIHHSNAIEGNSLSYGETQLVVEQGLTITGRPLKDSLEARNLSFALDYFEDLVAKTEQPITLHDIRQVHSAILKEIDDSNAGTYRQSEVQISGSKYQPPSYVHVQEKMEEFGQWLSRISRVTHPPIADPLILAAAAHAWFVYVHPFVDGNGRVARILLNLVLMRYGYPVSIITRDDRHRYYDALEESQSSDLTPFISLICDTVSESLDEYEKAATEQRTTEDWARSLVVKMEEREIAKIRGQFEVWRSAMELLRGSFKQVVDKLNEQTRIATIDFIEYDLLAFEKYLSLRQEQSGKLTWFFRVDFVVGDRHVRYLFFFGFASRLMSSRTPDGVSVFVAVEQPPLSSHYVRLDKADVPQPELREIVYSHDEESFIYRLANGNIKRHRVEVLVRQFVEEAIKTRF